MHSTNTLTHFPIVCKLLDYAPYPNPNTFWEHVYRIVVKKKHMGTFWTYILGGDSFSFFGGDKQKGGDIKSPNFLGLGYHTSPLAARSRRWGRP